MLQHSTTRCNTLYLTGANSIAGAATLGALLCRPPLSIPLQHTATHCDTLQHTRILAQQLEALSSIYLQRAITLQHAATHYTTLHHVRVLVQQLKARPPPSHLAATLCHTLQHTAIHCNTLKDFRSSSRCSPLSPSIEPSPCNTLQHTRVLVQQLLALYYVALD